MAKPSEFDEHDNQSLPVNPETGAPMTPRERRTAVVKALAAVGRTLFPLREELDHILASGEEVDETLQDEIANVQAQYRRLEDELRGLMRPRVKDEWLYGGHRHGADDAHDHGHA
jgi:hypothetical protein